MYTIAFLLIIFIAGLITYRGVTSNRKYVWILGILLGAFTLLFFGFMGFWGEILWFRQLGYSERFWKVWLTKSGLFAGAFLLSGILILPLTYSLKKDTILIRYITFVIAGLTGGILWSVNWEIFLIYLNRVPTTTTEPLLNRTTGFYLFSYPFLKILYTSLLYTGFIAFAANLIAILKPAYIEGGGFRIKEPIHPTNSIFTATGCLLLILAFGRSLKRFDLFFSQQGVVFGPGWTDDHIRLPMLLLAVIFTAIGGLIMFIPLVRQSIRIQLQGLRRGLEAVLLVPVSVFIVWAILLGFIPMLFQQLKVEPNEITLEEPYIKNNIEFTRAGFQLDKVEVNEFPASEKISPETFENNKSWK